MKKRNITLPLFLLALVFVIFLIRRWNEPQRKEAFDRHPAKMRYTRQAQCSLECRNISKADVEEIMQKGIIHFSRSNRMARPCPVFVLQGRTSRGKSMQVIFSQCADETKVITCYYLKDTTACPCPGKEKG